jgi:hypothetical protein
VITAPTAAAVMQQTAVHWAGESISPKTANPASPAATGSRFCSTPTTRGGSLRRAANSSEYGPAAESTATASPTSSTSGRASRVPLSATPAGTHSRAAQATARASGEPSTASRPARLLSRR